MSDEPGKRVTEGKAIVLYDGVCNLCSGTVRFILRRDPAAAFHFAALQSATGKALLAKYGLSEQEMRTIVLIEDGEAYTKSDAALRMARRLGGLWPALRAFRIVPPFIRDYCYDVVARHRYRWFGKKEVCELPPADFKERFL